MAILGRVVEQDSDIDVRLSALNDLATFKDSAAVQTLGKALDDYDPAIQFRAVQALKTSTGLDYGDSVPAWRDYVQGRQPTPPESPSLVQRLYEWF